MQLVVPPRDEINFIYIMNCGLWAIRIGFGKQSNPEDLGPHGKVSALLGGNFNFLGRSIYSVGQVWELKGRKLQSMKLGV